MLTIYTDNPLLEDWLKPNGKLAKIERNAQVNKIEKISVNNLFLPIEEKTVNIDTTILISPNGTKFKLCVSDNGELYTKLIEE